MLFDLFAAFATRRHRTRTSDLRATLEEHRRYHAFSVRMPTANRGEVQMMRVRWIVLVLVVTMFGCNTLGGKKKQKEEEDIKTAQEALKRSQVDECLRLSTTPNSLLEPSAIKYHDQGIINDYRQLSEVTVLNRAQFCSVKSAQGDVTWMDAQGRRFGSTPFSLKKSVAAGATEKFSIADGTLTSGTLAGSASQAKVTFTAVEVIYPPP